MSGTSIRILNNGWKFTLGDPTGAKDAKFDDSKWQAVSVPHDWMVTKPYAKDNPSAKTNGCLPTGKTCWYRGSYHYKN